MQLEKDIMEGKDEDEETTEMSEIERQLLDVDSKYNKQLESEHKSGFDRLLRDRHNLSRFSAMEEDSIPDAKAEQIPDAKTEKNRLWEIALAE